MHISDDVLLMHYKTKNTFFDKNSLEISTGVVKEKYKLLFKHNKDLDVYVFFILTSNSQSCVKERTFQININHWEYRDNRHLKKQNSFLDVQKFIPMSKKDVLEKASNPVIGFSYVATLKSDKFQDLNILINNYKDSATLKTDFTRRDFLKEIVEDSPDIDSNNIINFLNKFNI